MERLARVFRSIKELHRPFYKGMALVFFLLVIGQLVFLVRPYLQGKLIDVLGQNGSTEVLLVIALLLLVSYVAVNLIGYLREYLEWKILYFDIQAHITLEGMKKLFAYSIGQHTNEHSGLRQNVVNRGESALRNLTENVTYNILPLALQVILASVAIMVSSPYVGVIVLASSVLYLYLTIKFNTLIYPVIKENRTNWVRLGKIHSEMLRHLPLIKAESQETSSIELYRKENHKAMEFAKKTWVRHTGVTHANQALIDAFQVLTLFAAAIMVTKGIHTPGVVVAIIGWVSSTFGNISNFGWMQRNVIQQVADIEGYLDMLQIPPAIIEKPSAVSLTNINGKIEFQEVSFAYPKVAKNNEESSAEIDSKRADEEVSREALFDLNFTINPGETVARRDCSDCRPFRGWQNNYCSTASSRL